MPDKSKFEREIDEILEKTDADDSISTGDPSQSRRPPSKPKAFEPFSGTAPKRSQSKKRSTSISLKPGNVIIAGLVILAVAAFTPAAKILIALVGIGLLAIGYVFWFQSGAGQSGSSTSDTGNRGFFGRNRSPKNSQPSAPEVKYWRGRRIEEKPESPKTPKPRDSNDSDDLGKIIDFRSGDDDDKS
ncbi:MAG: hypothetical protein HOF01_02020 [Chloroflexi bacterium]|jgi:hypothetical protein|nr:hypothetical protein [Chloroflexota bacterium]